jgi:hypothetical protein
MLPICAQGQNMFLASGKITLEISRINAHIRKRAAS